MKSEMEFLFKEVKRCNRNLFILSFIMMFFAIIILFVLVHDYYITKMPPEQIDINKARSGSYLLGMFSGYYSIEGNEVINVGGEDFIIHLNGKKKIFLPSDYALVKYKEYWVPVRLPDKTSLLLTKYNGKLTGIHDEVFAELKNRAEKVNNKGFDPDKLLNIALDTNIDIGFLAYVVVFISLVFLLIVIANITKVVRRSRNPNCSPIICNLDEYGDIWRVSKSIENEVGFENCTDKVIITKSWFIYKRLFNTGIIPLSDIVWAYTKKRWKRWNGIIPIYKKTELNIILRNKTKIIPSYFLKENAENALDKLKTFAPWIFSGFSKEFKKLHNTNFNLLVKKVDEVKKQFEYRS